MKALRINSAGIDGRTIAVSRIDPPRDPIAFFERLKLSFLQWATELPDGHHSLSVTANTPDRDRLYVDLFDTVCGLEH